MDIRFSKIAPRLLLAAVAVFSIAGASARQQQAPASELPEIEVQWQSIRFEGGAIRDVAKPVGLTYRAGYLFMVDALRPRLLITRAAQPYQVIQQIPSTDWGDSKKGKLTSIVYLDKLDRFLVSHELVGDRTMVSTFKIRLNAEQEFKVQTPTTATLDLVLPNPSRPADIDPLAVELSQAPGGPYIGDLQVRIGHGMDVSPFNLQNAIKTDGLSSLHPLVLNTFARPPEASATSYSGGFFYPYFIVQTDAGGAPKLQLQRLGNPVAAFDAPGTPTGLAMTGTTIYMTVYDARSRNAYIAAVPRLTVPSTM
jgi:hypothetical protein